MIIANDQYICRVEPTGIRYFSITHSNTLEVNTAFTITAAALPVDSSMLYFSDGEFLYTFDMGHENDNIRKITIPKTGSIKQLYSATNNICTLLVLLTEVELLLVTDRNGVVHTIRHALEYPPPFYAMNLSSLAHLFTDPPGIVKSESSSPANFFLSIALHNLQSIEYRFAVSIVDNASLSISIASTSTLIPKVSQRILFFKYFGRQIVFVTTGMLYFISQADYLAIPIDQSLARSIRNIKVYTLLSDTSATGNTPTFHRNFSCIVFLFCKDINCHVVNLETKTVKEILDTNGAEHAYENNKSCCFVSEDVQKEILLTELARYF
ncbi:Hypothetical protein GLP15_2860 [Giardia lamblia P15]|uniref:Uncharacterized protein n=1 Tax=Giardia intestinalis (strain P15) TaxID=658858 RepID=E1F1W6_GIAIA|nr:Hypothetical protein GLP15_2860 [Giardia lamblia P15]